MSFPVVCNLRICNEGGWLERFWAIQQNNQSDPQSENQECDKRLVIRASNWKQYPGDINHRVEKDGNKHTLTGVFIDPDDNDPQSNSAWALPENPVGVVSQLRLGDHMPERSDDPTNEGSD